MCPGSRRTLLAPIATIRVRIQLAQPILIYYFVTSAGFMPVPGGVGVAEAAYTAGLVAIGIPQEAATSTALMMRLITFYLADCDLRSANRARISKTEIGFSKRHIVTEMQRPNRIRRSVSPFRNIPHVNLRGNVLQA